MTAPAPQPLFQNAAGLPPNEGVPLSRWVMVPPEPPQQNAPATADPGEWTAEEQQIVWAQFAMMLRQLFQALMDAAQAGAPPAPPPAEATDELAFWRNDIGYFFLEKHTTIRFLASGVRPCDHPGLWTQNFEYQSLKLPSNTTVAEMVRRVGVPNRGLQEMVELVVVSANFFSCNKKFFLIDA